MKTIIKKYDSEEALQNVKQDLVATGIVQDEIFIDKVKMLVKVMIPAETEAEIEEILGRHQPLD